MVSVLITGASRGIGLQLVKEFLSTPFSPATLIASCRDPENATELQSLASKHKNLHLLKLDISDFNSFTEVAQEVEYIVGDKGLNVLINNAATALKDKFTAIEDVSIFEYKRILDTNLVGPFFLIQELLYLVRRANICNQDKPLSIRRAAIVNITSRMGSVSMNKNDPEMLNDWAYRESKSALNQFSRSLCRTLEPEGILVSPIHPGWVQTELGGSDAITEPNESAKGIIRILCQLSKENNGKFLTWEGNELAW